MRYWIEVVSGEWNWEKLIKGERGLNAPDTKRYRNFFEGMEAGDLVLHYLTGPLTRTKERRSSVVGASVVGSRPEINGKKIVANCSKVAEFARPVRFSEVKALPMKSPSLVRLVSMTMQIYLTEITRSDFENIVGVYGENGRTVADSWL